MFSKLIIAIYAFVETIGKTKSKDQPPVLYANCYCIKFLLKAIINFIMIQFHQKKFQCVYVLNI